MRNQFSKIRWDVILGSILSIVLFVGAWRGWLPVSLTEASGFITGGICVWLVIKQNIWNWPVGIANNIFFIVLFLETKLYADMALQFVYIVLGALGWYWWLHGGSNRTELPVRNADAATLGISAIVAISSTVAVTLLLIRVNGAAPLWDAITTTLSLAAQYLLTRKLIENWYLWIAADLIYIPLYISKGLYLTAALYSLFLGMCVMGLIGWRKSLDTNSHVAVATG